MEIKYADLKTKYDNVCERLYLYKEKRRRLDALTQTLVTNKIAIRKARERYAICPSDNLKVFVMKLDRAYKTLAIGVNGMTSSDCLNISVCTDEKDRLELEMAALTKVKLLFTECVACMNNECDVALLPCGHKCACKTCARLCFKLNGSCPVCRSHIDKIVTFN